MKYYFSSVITAFFIIALISCEKESDISQKAESPVQAQGQFFHSVSSDEYAKSTPRVKRMIDQIDAAVNALDVLSNNKDFNNYEAIVSVSSDPKNMFSNSIIISASEEKSAARAAAPDHKCLICGVRSAYDCIDEINDYMDANHKNELDIHIKRVTRNGDKCIELTY